MSRKRKLPPPGRVFVLFMAGVSFTEICRLFDAVLVDVETAFRVHLNRIERRRHR